MTTSLAYTRTEPQTIRRGFEWRYRIQVNTVNAEGEIVPQSLVGFTITPELTIAESKTSTAAPADIDHIIVSTEAGQFDVFVTQAEGENLVTGKTYNWRVYISHPTITSGNDFLVRDGVIKVPA